jgi:hypothetical protein
MRKIFFYFVPTTYYFTLVVIGTDFIGSCKSNYHMITTTMTPRNTLRNACIQHFTWAFRFSGSIIIGIKIHRRYQNGTGSETSYLLFIYIIHCLSFFKNYKLESVFCTSDSTQDALHSWRLGRCNYQYSDFLGKKQQ